MFKYFSYKTKQDINKEGMVIIDKIKLINK